MSSFSTTDPKIEEFIRSKLTPGRINQHTATEYARDLERFGKFLQGTNRGPYPKLDEASQEDIERFLAVVREDNSVTSTKRKFAAIKGFYQFLYRKKYRRDNPASEIGLPSSPRRAEKLFILSREEIRKLFECPSGEHALRDKAILHFFYSGP
jgi:integrase/recombinase XerD